MRPVLAAAGGFELWAGSFFSGLAALAAYGWFARRRAALPLDDEEFWTLLAALAGGVTFGSLLLYILLYGRGPGANLGGLASGVVPGGAFLGGFWGAAAAARLRTRGKPGAWAAASDTLGEASLLGLAVQRAGCFLNGCCHGKPTTAAWGVVFSDPRCAVPDRWLGIALHPTQLLEAAGCLALFAALRLSPRRPAPGATFWLTVLGYGVMRAAADLTRGSDAGLASIGPLTTAQLLALAGAAAAAAALRKRAA